MARTAARQVACLLHRCCASALLSEAPAGRGAVRSAAALPQIAAWQRHTSSAAAGAGVVDVYVVPLPKLSHTMTKGRLVRWHKAPGERVNLYDVLFEVATDELTEEVFRVGDFAGTVNLVVEAHEEGWLAAVWHPADASRDLQVGTPVGLVCGEEQDVERVAKAYRCPTTDVYDAAQPAVPVLTWQSHLARGTRKVKCMG